MKKSSNYNGKDDGVGCRAKKNSSIISQWERFSFLFISSFDDRRRGIEEELICNAKTASSSTTNQPTNEATKGIWNCCRQFNGSQIIIFVAQLRLLRRASSCLAEPPTTAATSGVIKKYYHMVKCCAAAYRLSSSSLPAKKLDLTLTRWGGPDCVANITIHVIILIIAPLSHVGQTGG